MRLSKVLSSLSTAALAGRRLHFGMNERRTTGGSMALSLGTVDRNSVAWSLARSQRLNAWIGPYRMPAARAPSRLVAKAASRAFAPEDERRSTTSTPRALTNVHHTGPPTELTGEP